MTISNNSMMSSYASQISNNKNVQSQSGASGNATQSMDGSKAFDAIAQMLMTALDTNKTGTIDKTEFSEASKILAKSQSSENMDNAFGKIDADSNGQISSDEFMNALKELNNKKEQHKFHADKNSLDSSLLSQQTDQLIQQPSSQTQTNEMQKTLFDKIKAAYANTATTTGMTTNFSV
ncbi:MAG: EF-hand domain-containing protein [Sulfurimonas sp.]|nr:EF-hand domain-containing protein [Sulfurimonas sp.]